MTPKSLLLTAASCLFIVLLNGQSISVHPTYIKTGTFIGISRALRDLPVMTNKDWRKMERQAKTYELNEGLETRSYPFAATALPKGEDPLWQKKMGKIKSSNGPIVNFDGQVSPYFPPDCNGVSGPNHFFQTVNCIYAIYDKTGTKVAGPTNINLLFQGMPGATHNDGDPIVLYDKQADRWLVTEFSISGNPNYIMMAVSVTNDPTGSYYKYSFQVASMPDYPKFAVWQDGYYMGDNNGGNHDIYVMERTPMLSGSTAQCIGFTNPNRPSSVDGFMCVPPINNDGPFAPAGTPGYYIAFNDDAIGGGTDQLWLYELTVNWTTPAMSGFARTQQIDVQPFSASFGNNWNNIIQPGTNQKVDGIPQVIMNVPQYRNFGSYQTIVCCHTVNVDGQHHAGVRWYELRKTTGDWSIRQQGTYAPDAQSRWMGSIMLNGQNKIGLGYSVSSSTVYPSIRYCGQSPAAYNLANGIMDIQEDTIQTGSYSQSGANRWGDYSLLSVDPNDDATFWFTSEYIGAGNARKSKIASFKFIFAPIVTSTTATSVTGISATLNGTVSANGIPTNCRFAYGTDQLTLTDSTSSADIGSGTDTLNMTVNVNSLQSNTTYYFRSLGINADGISPGEVLTFTTGDAPTLAVTPPNRNVALTAGNTEFYVASNTDWTVTSDASWCTVTTSGTGNDTISSSYTEYTVVGSRIAHITVTALGGLTQIVTVTQAGIPATLAVNPPNRNVLLSSGNTKFYVTSNTNWNVTSNSSWCTITSSGSGNDSITATFEANNLYYPRIDTLIVTANGVGSVLATVTQDGLVPTLLVNPQNQNVSSPAGSILFDITTNLSWEVTSDTSWCTVTTTGSGNGTIVANFTENPGQQTRVAHIKITSPQVPPYMLQQNITVTQAKPNNGTGDKNAQAVKIYPNPTKGIFRIIPASVSGTLNVTVEDNTGKVILTKECRGEKEYMIDLSKSAEGTYNIVLKTNNETIVRKLVIIK